MLKPIAFRERWSSLLDSCDNEVGRVESCSPVDGLEIDKLVEEASPWFSRVALAFEFGAAGCAASEGAGELPGLSPSRCLSATKSEAFREIGGVALGDGPADPVFCAARMTLRADSADGTRDAGKEQGSKLKFESCLSISFDLFSPCVRLCIGSTNASG